MTFNFAWTMPYICRCGKVVRHDDLGSWADESGGNSCSGWPDQDDEPGFHKPAFEELEAADFTSYDEHGHIDVDLPKDLPYDEAKCSLCGASIGFVFWEGEDSFGREQAGDTWNPTYRTMAGRLVCEDCTYDPESVS